MTNIFDQSYELIEQFVSLPQNSRLKAGTGGYSTLFRGTLFGNTQSSVVNERLKEEPVKVLWLGSNPNVPDSLKNIMNDNGANHYQKFIFQKQSGHFSEVIKNSKTGMLSPGWDPINRPNYHWRFYTDIFNRLYGPGRILMANYVPWGSSNFSQLLRQLSALDKGLLQRMLDFSTMLNKRLIEHIKPEVVVVPKSICCSQLKHSHLCSGLSGSTRSYRVDAKVPFKFSVKEGVMGANKIKMLISPHPSYTSRVGKEYRESVQGAVADALQ